MKPITPFSERILPAPKGKGCWQDDYWVWCGSVAEGEDGRYHMFAARWPKQYPFFQGYLAASEVVRASSDDPLGPYTFEEVVFADRGSEYWDGRMTHNPFIVKYGDEYLLFYIGSTYEGPRPTREKMVEFRNKSGGHGEAFPWIGSIRIGMARSNSVFGPWNRPDSPTLDSSPGSWDNRKITNPAPCILPDGRILLYYRGSGCKLGLATANSPDEPFVKHGDRPVVDPGEGLRIEDPYVFWNGVLYEMVCKDLTGNITGEFHAGVHLTSEDGVDWELAPQPKAWSRTIQWDDGSVTTQGSIERPFILMQDGRPAYLFAATADGPGPRDGRPGFYFADNAWNMVIPLKR